jgi:hypothetical protein
MKYRLVQTVDGHMVKSEFEGDAIYPAMELRGYEFTGLNDNDHHREELQGQPRFRGVLGPMWDGDAVRYECPETYDRLGSGRGGGRRAIFSSCAHTIRHSCR